MNWSKKPRDPIQLGIKIQVDAIAMQKFWQWVDLAKGEVSALGLVDEIRDDQTGMVTALRVTDMLLVKQNCTSDETTMDPAAIAQLIIDLEKAGIDSRKLRCWIHSHGQMSVFWSSTDDECITGLANGEWLVSLVVNKKRDSMCRLDQYHPCHLFVTDVAWEVYSPLPESLAKACFDEFKAKVTEHTWGAGKHRVVEIEQRHDLHSAHERGALTQDELEEELDWLGWGRDEFEEQPF